MCFFYLFYSSGNGKNVLVGYPYSLCLSPDLLVVPLPLVVPSILFIELVVDFE